MGNKENLILVIAETRTTFDIACCFDEYHKSNLAGELSKKLWELRKNLSGDKLILASATFIHRSIDWNSGHMDMSICSQACIEGFKSNGEFINDDNSSMGLCFYEDGYVQLDKSQGFGNWKLDYKQKEGTLENKTTEYIKELSNKYNITYLVEINDKGFGEPIIDYDLIKQMGIVSIKIDPAKPFNDYMRSDYVNFGDNIYVSSSKISFKGAIDGLEQLNAELKKQNPVLKKQKLNINN